MKTTTIVVFAAMALASAADPAPQAAAAAPSVQAEASGPPSEPLQASSDKGEQYYGDDYGYHGRPWWWHRRHHHHRRHRPIIIITGGESDVVPN